jgi:hypothetical protein
MPAHRSLPAPERAVRSRLLRLLSQPRPLLRAGLVTMRRRCGKPSCRCAQGQPHVSLYLAARLGAQRKMIFVPKDLEEQARQWVADGQRAAADLDQLSQLALARLLRQKERNEARS